MIRVTHHKKIYKGRTWFGRKVYTYEETIAEFNGFCDGIQKAINHCFQIDSETPYFKIEKIYCAGRSDESAHEINFPTLVSGLYYSAKSEGNAEQKKWHDEQGSIEAINQRVKTAVKWAVTSAMNTAKNQITEIVMNELENAKCEADE
jgi:hypothetical protein